eukprot:2606700-Prymnesium_polylepis.1
MRTIGQPALDGAGRVGRVQGAGLWVGDQDLLMPAGSVKDLKRTSSSHSSSKSRNAIACSRVMKRWPA